MHFYLTQNGEKLGPYPIEQIRVFLQQGLVTTADQVWADGWQAWMPISNVPGMFGPTLSGDPPLTSPNAHNVPAPVTEATKWLCVWMHLSQFTAFITLLAGYLLPVLIWQTNKTVHPIVDKQGRIIANWIITSLIYDLVVIVLCFFWIGFLIAPFLVMTEFAFPIIGAWKASKGEVWNYPMNIQFFKI